MDAWIGLGGVIVGAALTILGTVLYHWHTQRTDLFKRLLAFYWSRIEAFKAVEGTLAVSFDEPELEKARAPLNAELILVAPQNVLDAEQKMYEFMHDREFQKTMKMRQFHQDRTQVTMRGGKGYNENFALDLENLKHAQALFDEAYEKLVNTLRQEMKFCKTLETTMWRRIPQLKLPSRFATFRPFNLIGERMYKDPDSVEAILRGRIADRMAAQGASAFDVHAMTEMLVGSSPSFDYAIELSPLTPRRPDERNIIVFGALGYDYIYCYSQERAEECKRNISEYFSRVPAGRIVLKKRSNFNPRHWDNVMTVTSETVHQLYEFIDQRLGQSQDEMLEKQREEEKEWADILTRAGKTVPSLSR